jgi:hypothetical protein
VYNYNYNPASSQFFKKVVRNKTDSFKSNSLDGQLGWLSVYKIKEASL